MNIVNISNVIFLSKYILGILQLEIAPTTQIKKRDNKSK